MQYWYMYKETIEEMCIASINEDSFIHTRKKMKENINMGSTLAWSMNACRLPSIIQNLLIKYHYSRTNKVITDTSNIDINI
jgi:hypothetical protein